MTRNLIPAAALRFQHVSHKPKRVNHQLLKKESNTRHNFPTERSGKKKYQWVSCTDSSEGMFCTICQKWGKPSAGSRGAWTTRGLTDWCHATELLKSHANSTCHKDAAVTASMAQQAERGKTVLELQCSAAAKELAEKKQQNREILLKLLRSVYFIL